MFSSQVAKTPNNIALSSHEGEFTYEQLNKESNYLAQHLISQNIQTNDIVAIITDSSKYQIISILAILKAGGAFLPIDNSLPQKRIVSMLEDSQTKFILSTNENIKQFSFTKLMGLYENDLNKIKTIPRPQLNFEKLPHPDRSLVNYVKYHSFIGEALAQHSID